MCENGEGVVKGGVRGTWTVGKGEGFRFLLYKNREGRNPQPRDRLVPTGGKEVGGRKN